MNSRDKGSTFDDWLREEGLYEETTAAAIRRMMARQLEAAIESKGRLTMGDGPAPCGAESGARPEE